MTTVLDEMYKLDVGTMLDFYVLDTTAFDGGSIFRFHSGLNELREAIIWQGEQYDPFPISFKGVKRSISGTQARPTVTVANISGLLSPQIKDNDDLVGAIFTRKRTLIKYLDNLNFTGNQNPSGLADQDAHFQDEVYKVNRKVNENKIFIEWELATFWEVHAARIPARRLVANTCVWIYKKDGECSWNGPPYYKSDDTVTALLSEDSCGHRLESCKVRFKYLPLPFGAFPSVGRY